MPHELHHERQPGYTGELTLGLAPDGALQFDDGVATVADEARAEAIADRYAAIVYAGAADADSGEDGDGVGGEGGETDDETGDEEHTFDAAAFVDRTPMADVVEDIESGEVDAHLEEIAATADRVGVQDAVETRME
jgi:hypothetical protein